jgi:cytidylate kinase
MKKSLNTRMIVAIDGPAGAGKSTIARRVADRSGFLYIDTGAMYRAVALAALRAAVPLDNQTALARIADEAQIELGASVMLNGEDVSEAIRTPEVSQAASKVSAAPGVRVALVRKQQAMGARNRAVMEGRDIGTVVFPRAEVKIFLTASPEERARRRVEELRAKGVAADHADVAREMRERDLRDSTREVSPLRKADDAVEVDTTGLTLEQVEAVVLALVEARMSKMEESAT